MRIAWYHHQAPGGARRALHELCRELARRHVVDVFSLETADESFLQSGVVGREVTVFPFRPHVPLRHAVGLNMARWLHDLKRLERLSGVVAARIDAGGYDVVLTDPCRFTQAAPSVLAHSLTPTAYYCHEPPRRFLEAVCRPEAAPLPPRERARAWARGRLYDLVTKPLDRRNVLAASLVLANSAMTRATIADYYERDSAVSPLGVDAARFAPPSDPERGDYVFSVGALAVAKGFDFLIRGLGRYPRRTRPRLVIAANADHASVGRQLTRLAAGCDVRLEIRSAVSDAEIVQLYQGARAFVFASHFEPFGLAVLEAMACGTPVVAVGEGGPTETVIDGVTGRLVERDEEAFAGALSGILADPAAARAMGDAGRAHVVANWTWVAAGERLETLLGGIAAGDVRAA